MTNYSHRNGETEPPTISGRYWLEGEMPQRTGTKPWAYTFGAGDDLPLLIDVEAGIIDLDGAGYHKPLMAYKGRFWGPVQMPVPPWAVTP